MTMEDVAKVATSVVEVLRGSPVVLGMILLNIIFMAVIFFTLQNLRNHQHQQMMLMLERCVPQYVKP
jgi:hypothetical protein